MANDKVKISLPVVPTLDRRASRTVTQEIKELERQIGPIKVSFDQLAKQASSSVKELNKVSSAAVEMNKAIGRTVKQAKDQVSSLNKTLQGVKGGGGGGGSKADDDASDAQQDLVDTTEDLNDAMTDLLKNTKSQVDASKRAAKAQSDLAKAMKVRSKEKFEGFGDMMKDLPNLFKKGGFGQGIKGVGGGLGKMIGHTGTGPTAGAKAMASAGGGGGGGGMAAGGAAAGGGGMGAAAGALMRAGPYIAAAAAAIMAIAKILQMASESQTKINKAMLDGVGYANDFGVSVQGYRDGIDELRDAIQDTSYTMLKFGGTSEQTAKIINRFTKESTGSLMQTRNELSQMPGGLQGGVAAMAKAATAYGKALGMEADEAAAMMGRFTNELGLSAQGSIDAMQNIVKAASQSNMPMAKFLEIFHKVIPDVELYQNRLEELTGTVKLLSKTMSAKDVKNFMDAFSKGFKGTDFKQRLKTTLVAGTDTVSNALEKDFDSKARSMAKNFAEYGVSEDDFVAAMKGGEKSMAALINKAQASASQQGKQLQGTQVSDAMKLAGYEASRQKGGALNLATAMSGGGTMATYKILSKFGQTLTTGFDGLSEHVMKQLGISEQQYEALRTTAQSLKVQKDMLKTYGKTNSKSMNDALRETVKLRKKGMTEKEIEDAMQNATDDELFAASERQQADKKDSEKAFDLASEQYNVTTSIGDKIDNVIGFLLEQMLRVLNPMLDVLNDLLSWTMSGDKRAAKETDQVIDALKSQNKEAYAKIGGGKEQMDMFGAEIKKNLEAGKSGKDLAEAVSKSHVFDGMKDFKVGTLMEAFKGTVGEKADFKKAFEEAQSKGDMAGMLKALDELPGSMQEKLAQLGDTMVKAGKVSDEAKARAEGRSTVKAKQVRSATAQEEVARRQAGQASYVVALGAPLADQKRSAQLEAGYKKAADAMGMSVEDYKKETSEMLNKLKKERGGKVTDKDLKQLGVTKEEFDDLTSAVKDAVPAAAAAPGAPATPAAVAGAPAAGGTPAAAVKDTHAAIQDTANAAVDQSKTVDQQLQTQEDAYAATSDMLSLLKKGIRYEQSWMGTKYKNVLKDATLESFRTALVEYAVLEAKMKSDPQFTKALADNAWNIAAKGAQAMSELHLAKAGEDKLSNLVGYQVEGHYATGGPIDYDQIAQVHKGEFVIPKGGMLVKGGEGGKSITINATINAHTDATPEQIAAEIHNLYRAH